MVLSSVFGGQTPLKIAKALEENGVHILGTSPEGIDLAEDRERFGALLRKNNIHTSKIRHSVHCQ